ncbi:hypothetical protein [Luteimonas vadosa]|uniref:Tetratricopeptide repeat protein n=1 Tax=Luteimonas vadosa TaxID=1165507 RepID=A0ABP9E3T8_9GAMM
MNLLDPKTGDAQLHRRSFFQLPVTGLVILAGLLLAGGVLHAQQGRPRAWIPESADTVVERLPRGYAALVPRGPVPASGAPPSLDEAQRLLATAASTGDARLAARAASLLDRSGDTESVDALRARAFSAQHQHDFGSALSLLDRAVALDPRNGDARLARAQIQMVRGALGRARTDCIALALGVDARAGTLCVAAMALRRGQFDDAARLTDRWLEQSGDGDPLRRHAYVQRGEIAARSGDPAIDRWFRRALDLAPGDVRTLSAYARALGDAGRHRDVLLLLRNAPDHDGLALLQTRSASALGLRQAPAMRERQARRYRLARAMGSEPELRDEAELMLLMGHDELALSLAQRNFETQRDHEDVDILLRSARAVARPDALQPARDWATAQGLALDAPGDAP